MGNKLCAPWRKDYRDDNHPWAPKKDSHLLRLWAEIFQVEEDDGDICWARVSDDVVPVNITCIADTPETVFQISAYNRHVEKIFDVKLIQPGTLITQASECFVHWKDPRSGREWGLNFTTPVDARRFRECCMNRTMPSLWRKSSLASLRESLRKAPATQGYARKASSSGSLRLSPPKRVRGRKATSNPTSPLTEPKRAFSNPEGISGQDTHFPHAEAEQPPSKRNGVQSHGLEHIATVPRGRQRAIPSAQAVFDQGASSSNSSSYDNIGTANRRKQKVECDNQCPHNTVQASATPKTKYRPIGEREIPFTEYQPRAQENPYVTQASILREKERLEQQLERQITEEEEGEYTGVADYEEVRQFSREPTCMHLSADTQSKQTDSLTHNKQTKDTPSQSKQAKDTPSQSKQTDTTTAQNKQTDTATTDGKKINNESQYDKFPPHIGKSQPSNTASSHISKQSSEGDSNLLSPPRKSHSSSSPEWPPPPESLDEPNSPYSPSGGFDSNTLKRMLQNLPDQTTPSPKYDNSKDSVFEYSTLHGVTRQKNNNGSGYKSPNSQHSSHKNKGQCATEKTGKTNNNKIMTSSLDSSEDKLFKLRNPPVKPTRMGVDSTDLRYCKSKTRDSYPDSGISGMTNDTTCSVRSGDSGRSGHSGRSTTLPPGLGLSSLRSKSSTHSSGGSSSGKQSDLIRQSVTGSETTEVKQFTNSDIESESCGSESEHSDSSIHTMCTESQSTLASKSAAVRKAGWLTVKNWLIHRKRKVELAPRRTWKKYWVCLKGTALLFYQCDDNDSVSEENSPRHVLVIEQGIAQAVPEHPKRENIFALSTVFGDAYLFEAPSQIELENWISGIHSACASSFARQHGKENTLKLLQTEIQKLENSIDLDIKMKKMAGLQMNVVVDSKSKQAIEKQIAQWNENLEKLYIEQYRLRCYMASLQGSELPNPKNLLSCVSKQTKAVLSRVGVFTVTAFHALVCARAPLSTTTLYAANKKKGIMSTFKAESLVAKMRPKSPMAYSQQAGLAGQSGNVSDHVVVDLQSREEESPQLPLESYSFCDNLLRIQLPNEQYVVVGISEKMTVAEVLEMACNKRQLNPTDHFIRIKMPGSESYKIPDKSLLLSSEEFDAIEVCAKVLFQLEVVRESAEVEFGLSVEAELAEDTEEEDELCVFISDIVKGSVAHKKGLQVGDEILVMNSKVVNELDMVFVENVLQEELQLTLTIRSCRVERPLNTSQLQQHADVYIENLMCPPPPSQTRISDKILDELIIPAPNWVNTENDSLATPRMVKSLPGDKEIDSLLVGAEQVTHFCRLLHAPSDSAGSSTETQGRTMNEAQRIRKVVVELVETERQYVKDLSCLIERYLDPLKEETFLCGEDIETLFGNIQEIVQFQKLFLQSLEEAIDMEPEFNIFSERKSFKDDDLKKVLFSIAGSFLYYANHFKLYSSFCASHSKAQKVLSSGDNSALHAFLRARNPKQQHSATLESYLIKPIQRILKYPLLLKQLKELTEPSSDQHQHLTESLRGMQTVAEHINEMQKIYEEYGAIFDDLTKSFKEFRTRSLDINVGDLQMYGNVNWLNALDELGKIKKGTDIVTMLFVFKGGVVILAQERLKGKRRQRNFQNRPVSNGNGEANDVIRFQLAMPVDELQVRTAISEYQGDRHGLWELVHCRSEKEGRPEKIFQFASSLEARKDFLKTLHCAIRESVRRMSLPAAKSLSNNLTRSRLFSNNSQQPNPSSNRNSDTLSPQIVPPSSRKALKPEMGRYSMNIEEKVDQAQDSEGSNDFTRSHTLTDLNQMGLQDQNQSTGSQSTLTSESSRTSAVKLLHSSNNPHNFSNQNIHRDSAGSPIWKPRNNLMSPAAKSRTQQPHSTEQTICTSSAYGNYASIVFDDKNSAVLLTPPNAALFDFDDTEC